jgi:hypothetical protein
VPGIVPIDEFKSCKDDGNLPARFCANVSAVPPGRLGFYETMPDTSYLANFHCRFAALARTPLQN